MDRLRQDLVFAIRGLAKSPGFVAIIVVTLALGVGANVAIFSVVDGMLLEALPYRDPERVVRIWDTKPSQGWEDASISPLNFEDWKERNHSFSEIAIVQSRNYNLSAGEQAGSSDGEPERIIGLATSANLFALLGRPPALGRDFRAGEDAPGAAPTVILSDRLWMRRFAGDPAIVGSTLRLDGIAHTVIGIAPPRFFFPENQTDAWIATAFPREPEARGNRSYGAIGRLAPGITSEQALADMQRVAKELETEHPDANAGWSSTVQPLIDDLLGEQVPQFFLLLTLSVAFVALIACANIASLLLSRSVVREREVSVRTVLGATRGRLLRQLLTETLILAVAGGALGIAAAFPMVKVLISIAPAEAPRVDNISVDGSVLVYAALLTLITAVVFGLVPALQASKPDLHASLKDAARGSGGAPRHRMLRGLVAAEVALATTLLALGAITVRSIQDLLTQDPGFDVSDLLTFQLNVPESKYPDTPARALFFDRLMRELRGLPGVEAASAVQTLPLAGSNSWRGVTVEGIPLEDFEDRKSVGYLSIEDQYFDALDVPVLRGRALEGADLEEGANVLMVNQTFVERYWPRGEDPIGRRLHMGWEQAPDAPEAPWLTIVGVVADIRFSGLDDPPRPEIYVPYRNGGGRNMAVVLETSQDPASLATLVRETVARIDPDQPIYNVRTIADMLESGGSVGGMRAIAQIMGTLAIGALALAAIGIYGVITFTMSQRRQEIGIRRAMGAERRHILSLTLRQALVPVTVGLAIGLGLSMAGGRSLRGLLFGAQDANPVTYAIALGGLLAVAIAASLLPAARATRVDPLVVLRHE